MGTLGMKLGMTTLYDQWGDIVPVTIILLDRVQIVQIKRPEEGNKFYQVQMGIGERRIKRIKKAAMGHYLKAKVPPKRLLAEFPVSEECLLPVGYTMSARHYTPGMFVDVAGKTVGHGFTGTIKKYNFRRQPASHGNSLTTRVLGSTGGRQDPGRVFKQKKMYGRMGGNVSVQKGMTVFKIDVEKNILYIKGSLPGKAGTFLKIWDTLLVDKAEDNLRLSHFPTFVEQPGMSYAKQFSMYCGERDPLEIEIHDNAFILDDPDEAADKEDGGEPKDKDLEE
jgi:large subunit ribosomal protein L3